MPTRPPQSTHTYIYAHCDKLTHLPATKVPTGDGLQHLCILGGSAHFLRDDASPSTGPSIWRLNEVYDYAA